MSVGKMSDVNRLRASSVGGQLSVSGVTRQRVTTGVNAFFRSLPQLPPARVIDLLMIAVGVYAADRTVLRRGRQSVSGGVRNFEITFEVQDPAFWSQEEVRERVVDVLCFLTDDNWSISFEQSTENWHQAVLPLKWFAPSRIALFSEGLDSAAGLAASAVHGTHSVLLVTVGHYAALRRRAERQISHLAELMPEISAHHSSLLVSLRGGVARSLRLQEKSQRSRAFLFCSAAIAAAAACEVREVDIYENGVGAVNLPPMTGMLFGGLATRGAHPSLLQKMSAIGSMAADVPIAIRLPYATLTKGELIARLHGRGLDTWLQQSRSCIHTSLRTAGVSHCGVCPACIERRVAFAVAEIQEDPSRYVFDIFRVPPPPQNFDYLDALLEQSIALLSGDPSALRRLTAHLHITGVNLEDHERIHQLLLRNADETQRVLSSMSQRSSRAERALVDRNVELDAAGVAP